jgi:uncharacterized protein with FMN-binding domain
MRRSAVRLMTTISAVALVASFRESMVPLPHRMLARTVPVPSTRAVRTVPPMPVPPTRTRALTVGSNPASASPQPAVTRSPANSSETTPYVREPTRKPLTRRPSASASPKSAQSKTYYGAPADTPYGPVQVMITVRDRRIITSDAFNYPEGTDEDERINSDAIPKLDREAVQAQSAHIDTVSGATYTSEGYRQSLQSAIDRAHI